ncbi:MAG TPA: hypothetical protein VM187_15065 [Niastella sp.]|nr:hypothetical protein [Niastella sp.]
MLVLSNGVVAKRKVSEAAFSNAIRRINNNRDTAQVFTFRNTGSDLSIGGNNANSLFLTCPMPVPPPVVWFTTATQTFGGNKTFQDSVSASKAILAGSTGNANSTVQIAGSLSMAIKSITINYTVSAADNTILANTSSASLTDTLPAPTSPAVAAEL